jgi:hypothetical protein
LTGFLSAVRQPLRFHELIHVMTPLRRYWLSVWTSTRQGRLFQSSGLIRLPMFHHVMRPG